MVYILEPGVGAGGLVAVRRAEDTTRGPYALVDGVFRDAEIARDLLRGVPLEQQIETVTLFPGQALPALGITPVRPMRSIHVPSHSVFLPGYYCSVRTNFRVLLPVAPAILGESTPFRDSRTSNGKAFGAGRK